MAKKFLSKADIFNKKSLKSQSVHVEEWGGKVMFNPMTMNERREIRKEVSIRTVNAMGETEINVDQERFEVMCIVCCCVNEDGSPMFTKEDSDVLLSEMAAGPVSTLSTAIMKASGLMSDALTKSESVTAS